MAKYLQDMTLGQMVEISTEFITKSEKATVVLLKTVGIGGDMFEITEREEDGIKCQLLMVEAMVDGAEKLFGMEWSPELGIVLGSWVAPKKEIKD